MGRQCEFDPLTSKTHGWSLRPAGVPRAEPPLRRIRHCGDTNQRKAVKAAKAVLDMQAGSEAGGNLLSTHGWGLTPGRPATTLPAPHFVPSRLLGHWGTIGKQHCSGPASQAEVGKVEAAVPPPPPSP